MALELVHINQLLDKAVNEELYVSLIQQLNKDFMLANIEEFISEKSKPEELKNQLHIIIENLINADFDAFLSLLYRVDLPENKIRRISKENHAIYIATVSFLILKREWQKVWFKQNYSP